jgi:hypothetical protein
LSQSGVLNHSFGWRYQTQPGATVRNMSEAAKLNSTVSADGPRDADRGRSKIIGITFVALGAVVTLVWTGFLVWLAIRIL